MGPLMPVLVLLGLILRIAEASPIPIRGFFRDI
jgi:hypothetical protein